MIVLINPRNFPKKDLKKKCYNLLTRMPKRRLKIRKGFLRPIHVTTFVIIAGYILVSRLVFFKFITASSLALSFAGPLAFGILTSFMFLYLFSHEDFFHFIKDIEKKEEKKEGDYLKKYKHFGKIAAVVVITLIGGTIFAALTVRLLLAHYKYKYFILLISMILSTVFTVGLAKGIFNFIVLR